MKNPFLSDRNIFSKVVNPLKKKTESDNKDNGTTDSFNKKEPFISTTPLTKPEQPKQFTQEHSKEPFRFQPQQKMTFGEPQQTQNRLSFNKNINRDAEIERNTDLPKQNVKRYDYGYQSFKMTQNQGNQYTKNNYKSISLEQNEDQFKSPAQENKFQEYRKVNNFKDYSPINAQPQKRINDSEFLNIDALGDDLNRFLAESKNQEELCQLLGIVKKPQYTQKDESKMDRKQPQVQRQEFQYYSVQNKYQKRLSENAPSAFAKQKIGNRQSEPLQPMKPAQRASESKIEERQYIPTFNYMGLQHQNETVSREQEPMPRFNPIPKKQILQNRQVSRQNIEVFDYSRTNSNQGEKDVQQLIAQEMSALCMNGKYRTFLTSNEKIVTVRYKLQPL